MNNQLPEHSWETKLYGYASPVDDALLFKVQQARKGNNDHPFTFWLWLPLLMFMTGGGFYMAGNNAQGIENGAADVMTGLHQNTVYPEANQSTLSSGQTNNDQIENLKRPEPSGQNILFTPNRKSTASPLTDKVETATDPGLPPAPLYLRERRNRYDASAYFKFGNYLGRYTLPPMFLPVEDKLNYPGNQVTNYSAIRIPGCPDFGDKARNDWYIEAFGALDMPVKKLVSNVDKSGFIQKKDSTEKFLLSYSEGLRLSKNISNSWLIKTGIQFSQFNERFDYRNEQEKRITTVITIRTIIRAPGDTLFISDTSQVEVIGVRIKKTYNRYRNIDIPLLLSYEIRNPGFTIAVQAGATFNIRSTFQGDMIDTSGVPFSQSGKNPSTQFRNSLGIGIYAGVSFIKSINPDWDVFAEPYYRRYIQNEASAEAPFQQYLSNWGLQLGLRYKLNHPGQRY